MQSTSWGELRPPLGVARLTCIGLVAGLLRTGSEEAAQAVIAAGILPVLLDLVLQYPLHSILHHQV